MLKITERARGEHIGRSLRSCQRSMILSMHSDEGYVLRALKAGAKAYLLKGSAEGDLIEAIKSSTKEEHSSVRR